MTEKELKRMSRIELIEIIAAQKKRELELQVQLEDAQQRLDELIERSSLSGSVSLNSIYAAAQTAADAYVESVYDACKKIENCMLQTQEKCARLLRKADEEAKLRIERAGKHKAL